MVSSVVSGVAGWTKMKGGGFTLEKVDCSDAMISVRERFWHGSVCKKIGGRDGLTSLGGARRC